MSPAGIQDQWLVSTASDVNSRSQPSNSSICEKTGTQCLTHGTLLVTWHATMQAGRKRGEWSARFLVWVVSPLLAATTIWWFASTTHGREVISCVAALALLVWQGAKWPAIAFWRATCYIFSWFQSGWIILPISGFGCKSEFYPPDVICCMITCSTLHNILHSQLSGFAGFNLLLLVQSGCKLHPSRARSPFGRDHCAPLSLQGSSAALYVLAVCSSHDLSTHHYASCCYTSAHADSGCCSTLVYKVSVPASLPVAASSLVLKCCKFSKVCDRAYLPQDCRPQ